MKKRELLDYLQDMNDNFWIVRSLQNGECFGYPVYTVDNDGVKYNHITNKYYVKTAEEIVPVPKKYKRVFKPSEFYRENKEKLEGVWKEYVLALNEIGIEDKDIGIFGSYLVGFDITKDVDFVIYGKENLYKYYDNIEYIKNKLNVTSITSIHAEYQYNKHKMKFAKECDLLEIVKRNWSGIELPNGVLSTPRFIDRNSQELPKKEGIDKKITVEVTNGLESAMLPRVAKVSYHGEEYKIMSNIWKFQSFAHIGDILEIYGNVNEDKKVILLDDTKYYIKFIKKSEQLLDSEDANDCYEIESLNSNAIFKEIETFG